MRYLWYISTSNPSEKYISASKLDLFCLPTFKKKTTSTAFKNSIKDHNSYSIYSCPLNVIQKKIRVFLFNDPKIRSARRWDLRFLRWSNSTSRRSWNPVVKKNAPKKQDCHTQSLPPPQKKIIFLIGCFFCWFSLRFCWTQILVYWGLVFLQLNVSKWPGFSSWGSVPSSKSSRQCWYN